MRDQINHSSAPPALARQLQAWTSNGRRRCATHTSTGPSIFPFILTLTLWTLAGGDRMEGRAVGYGGL
eukprot:354460-Chlamydomonas_euryale.AAC.5